MDKPRLVVLTGAGMSAESGIPTFRAVDGLWENHRVEDVASPQGWKKNPTLVLDFYNQRRKQILRSQPNRGHCILAALEDQFHVQIITQNIDDLHERAGSHSVLHLHGEILKARSTLDEKLIYSLNRELLLEGDLCELGSQLRPHIVWFGEDVPLIEKAATLVANADLFVVVGTSLLVYPAAGLVHVVPNEVPKYVIDPVIPALPPLENTTLLAKGAGEGLAELEMILRRK